MSWNTEPPLDNIIYDQRFVRLVLKEVLRDEAMSYNQMKFAKRKYIRNNCVLKYKYLIIIFVSCRHIRSPG